MVKAAPHKIKELYAFIATEKDGTEGIMSYYARNAGTWVPMIGSDFMRVDALKLIADKMCATTGHTYRIKRFVPGDPHDVTDQYK